ncbi:hypothetical protein ABZ348_00325 [Streptomyces sp. NPDC005963]|uniref:hypothetical protein n=1 Tax=Streptomyces sp. NPDC005963 TaxID=3156721 RepID=UPI0033C876EE
MESHARRPSALTGVGIRHHLETEAGRSPSPVAALHRTTGVPSPRPSYRRVVADLLVGGDGGGRDAVVELNSGG